MTIHFLQEADGSWSLRRLLAILFFMLAAVALVLCILRGAEVLVILAAVGLPIAASILLMFFTTWSDITSLVKAVKGGN